MLEGTFIFSQSKVLNASLHLHLAIFEGKKALSYTAHHQVW